MSIADCEIAVNLHGAVSYSLGVTFRLLIYMTVSIGVFILPYIVLLPQTSVYNCK